MYGKHTCIETDVNVRKGGRLNLHFLTFKPFFWVCLFPSLSLILFLLFTVECCTKLNNTLNVLYICRCIDVVFIILYYIYIYLKRTIKIFNKMQTIQKALKKGRNEGEKKIYCKSFLLNTYVTFCYVFILKFNIFHVMFFVYGVIKEFLVYFSMLLVAWHDGRI